MNQRSSHFTLGSSSVQYGSIYKVDYPPKQATTQKNPPHLNPFRGSSLQNNNKAPFQTTNNQMLKDWGLVETSKLDSKKLESLRTHHFNLGNYNPINNHNTSHKIFYDRKVISNDANKNQQDSKIKMRAHHHNFEEQNFTNFKSSYNDQYKRPEMEGNTQRVNPRSQNVSNAIILGNHKIPMITSNAIDYTQKKNDPAHAHLNNKLLQQSPALVLGNQKNNQPMQTINQLYYNKKQITKNQLPQATMKQLRATHFNLGSMKQNYNTESQLYQLFNVSKNNQLENAQNKYQSGSWNDKNAKFYGQTTNKRQLPQRNGQPYKKHGSSIKNGFNLGNAKNNYDTQFKSHYNEKPTNFPSDARGPSCKRQDNIQIGFDPLGHYTTEHKSNYKNYENNNQSKNDFKHIKNINTEDHFKTNASVSQTNQYHITTYQDQYRKDIQNKNIMFHKTSLNNQKQGIRISPNK